MPSTFTNLNYHMVFSTKDREPLLESAWRDRMYDFFGGCVRATGATCLEIGGTADHVHLLAGLKPTQSVSGFMCDVKRATSAWARDACLRSFAWQEGYGAFTVSQSVRVKVAQYIRNQREHHRTRSYQEEFRAFLTEAGIVFDERYVW